MEFKDYYATLGVTKASTEKEIKQAFRKLARKHHPDVNPGDKQAEARFKEINEAYEVLGDPAKRKKYDELGANWRMYEQAEAQGGPNPFAGRWNVNMGGGGVWRGRRLPHDDAGGDGGAVRRHQPLLRLLHDLLRRRPILAPAESRRGRGGRTRQRPGRDVEHEIELTLEDAYQGATQRLSLKHDGHARTVDVRIPAGVGDGSRVRVSGEGEHGVGGAVVRRPVPACPPRAPSGVRAQGTRSLREGSAAGDDRGARRRGGGADTRRASRCGCAFRRSPRTGRCSG